MRLFGRRGRGVAGRIYSPSGLAKVWTLTGHLEVQERQGLVFLWRRGEGDLVLFVVLGNQVLVDGAGFPDSDAGVGIFNGRDTEYVWSAYSRW